MSPSDQLALSQFNPGFKTLLVTGQSTLGTTSLLRPITNLSATSGSQTLALAQAGLIVLAPTTVVQTLTLPSVASAAGLVYEFVWTGPADGTHTSTIVSADSKACIGNLLNGAGSGTSTTTATTLGNLPNGSTSISRIASATLTSSGDRLRMMSDGTHWICDGLANVTTGNGLSWTVA